MGGGDDGRPTLLGDGGADLVQREAGVAVEHDHVDASSVVLVATVTGEGGRDEADAVLGTDVMIGEDRGQGGPGQLALIAPDRVRVVAEGAAEGVGRAL
jgi:hypothetical protein